MKKRLITFVLMFLLVAPIFVLAETDPCSGFWGTVSCLLWGNPDMQRGNIVGEASASPTLLNSLTDFDVFLKDENHYVRDNNNNNIYILKITGQLTPVNNFNLVGGIQQGRYTSSNGWKPVDDLTTLYGTSITNGQTFESVNSNILKVTTAPAPAPAPAPPAPAPSATPDSATTASFDFDPLDVSTAKTWSDVATASKSFDPSIGDDTSSAGVYGPVQEGWENAGFNTPEAALEWVNAGVVVPMTAKRYKDQRTTPAEVIASFANEVDTGGGDSVSDAETAAAVDPNAALDISIPAAAASAAPTPSASPIPSRPATLPAPDPKTGLRTGLDGATWSDDGKMARASDGTVYTYTPTKDGWNAETTGQTIPEGSNPISSGTAGKQNEIQTVTYKDPNGNTLVAVGTVDNSATLSATQYNNFKGQIISVTNGAAQLPDGGSISYKVENGIGESTLVTATNQPPVVRYELPDGTVREGSGGWSKTDTGLTNKDGQTITVSSDDKSNTVTITNKDTTSESTKTYKDGRKEVVTKNGNTETSHQLLNSEGRVIGETKDGKFYHYDAEGNLIGFCEGTCTADSSATWVRHEANGEYTTCTGSKTTCDAGGYQPTKGCTGNEQSGPCFLVSEKKSEDLLSGQANYQRQIGSIISAFSPGGQAISNWVMPEFTQKMRRIAQDSFGRAMITQGWVADQVCHYDENHRTDSEGSSAVFIDIGGTPQFVGSITSEKTPSLGPVLCSEELSCVRGECQKDGFCYENDQMLTATFYKITWGVSAPQDQSFTPYIDETGAAVKYNIVVRGANNLEKYLYLNNGVGTAATLTLVNGDRDGDSYYVYSPNDYTEACILFSAPPKDDSGDEVDDICRPIAVSSPGEVPLDTSEGGSSASAGDETSVKAGSLSRTQI